jgi:hypothetical protein
MIVDLVAESGVTDLVEPRKVIEARRVAVRHDETMKKNGEPGLPKTLDLARFAEQLRACRNQKMLAVMGIDIASEKAFDGAGERRCS